MASRLTKLSPRILVSSIAVFIFLSVAASSEDPPRCYWCGPLSEQVHRSQRAPSCSIFDFERYETVCDKGYTHCAIVVTSPPYAESRLCVKFYQDECYSLYCNSTKTWRMVCACRGDLCNGPNTDREIKAFATVPKFLGKTNARNKRSLISGFISVKTKTSSDNNTIIIINNQSEYLANLQSDQPVEPNENETNVDATVNDMPKPVEDNIIIEIEHGTFEHDVERNITHTSGKAETIGEGKMDNASPTITTLENQLDNVDKPTHILEVSTTAESVKETHDSDTTTTTSIKPIDIEVAVVHNKVTPGKLPPAEALQQNVIPTKAMELTTIMATVATVIDNHVVETTTQSNEIRNLKDKNSGAQNVAHLIIFAITFLVHYYC